MGVSYACQDAVVPYRLPAGKRGLVLGRIAEASS